MRKRSASTTDWNLIGHNVRFVRSARSMTQVELAQAAQVSPATVVSLEQGRPVRAKTLESLCAALQTSPSELLVSRALNLKTPDRPFVVHRVADAEWTAYVDRRSLIPEDDFERIQDPAERKRLGRLGLAPVFGTGPSFVMPKGPGVLIDEIYQAFEFPTDVYRDCILYCLRGSVRVAVGNAEPTRLEAGDMVGYSDDVTVNVAPAAPVGPDEAPPLVMWIGANRKGKLLMAGEPKRRRIRPRTR